jgi:hypothetical protein
MLGWAVTIVFLGLVVVLLLLAGVLWLIQNTHVGRIGWAARVLAAVNGLFNRTPRRTRVVGHLAMAGHTVLITWVWITVISLFALGAGSDGPLFSPTPRWAWGWRSCRSSNCSTG